MTERKAATAARADQTLGGRAAASGPWPGKAEPAALRLDIVVAKRRTWSVISMPGQLGRLGNAGGPSPLRGLPASRLTVDVSLQ